MSTEDADAGAGADVETLAEQVADELDTGRYGDKIVLSRRAAMSVMAGTATLGGVLGFGSGSASAQSTGDTSVGNLGGTDEGPMDVWVDQFYDPDGNEILNVDPNEPVNAQFGREWQFDSVSTGSVNGTVQVRDGDTIQGAHDALPSGGGTIEVTPNYNPADETIPIDVTKPLRVTGPGSDNPDGELDFSADSTNPIFDITLPTLNNDHENAVDIEGLRLVGGAVGIAITDLQFGGFRDLEIHNSGTGIEYRSGDQVNFGNKFYDVDIFGCGKGVATNGTGSNPDANAYFGCTVRDSTGNPIDIQQGYQFKWIGGMIEKNDGYINMDPTGDAHLWGVYIEENDQSTLTRDVEWRVDGGTIFGCRFQGIGNNDRAVNINFCEDAEMMYNNFVGYNSGFVQVNGNASDFNLDRNYAEDSTALIAADSGVRTRHEGTIGGGPLAGVDLSSTAGQYVGDRAIADGTSAAVTGALARWDGASWQYHDPTGAV